MSKISAMKKFNIALLAIMVVAALVAFKSHEMLELGSTAPLANVTMKDVSGKMLSLDDLRNENGLLVIFSCNTCPFVRNWESSYPELGKLTRANKIGMVLVNSNEGKRTNEDSFKEMQKHYQDASYNVPYLIDKDHELADAFGAKTTPHVYLFDKDMKLVYRGAIDDRFENREKEVRTTYLKNAIAELVKGEKITTPLTQERGCSIKRVEP